MNSAKMRRAFVALLGMSIALSAGCRKEAPRGPFTAGLIPPGLQARFYPPENWAWGLVKPARGSMRRYGVLAPAGSRRAHVLILPGAGDAAETWFETARDLSAKGYTVWVLEESAQAGGPRYGSQSGAAQRFAEDQAATAAFVSQVVREQPLFLLSERSSAPTALSVAAKGLPVQGLIIASPPSEDSASDLMPHQAGWRRDGPDDHAVGLTRDPVRGRVLQAWQGANPDLRAGGPPLGWTAAYLAESGAARTLAAQVKTPVLVTSTVGGAAAARKLCNALPSCALQTLGEGGPSLHLEMEPVRSAWLDRVDQFIRGRIAAFPPAAPEARVRPSG